MADRYIDEVEAPERRLQELRAKHEALEHRLKRLEEPRSTSPQEAKEMKVIKKQKLAIKDRITQLENEL